LLRAGKPEQALAHLEAAVRDRPNGFWPNFYQGVCAYRLKRYADAAAAFRVCLALAPDAAPVYHNRALVLAAMGQDAEALHHCEKALELDRTLAPAWAQRGVLHYRKGRLERAAADFQEALAHGADPAAMHYNLALVSLDRGDHAAALKH